MGVTPEAFERGLELVRQRVTDPKHGIYGPHTVAWRLNRESAVFLGGGRAALMQLAHPYVAHAIAQHSATRADVAGRFQRTFYHVDRTVWGDLDLAFSSARRVFKIHRRIQGTLTESGGRYRAGQRYEALDPGALFWVFATLVQSVVVVHDQLLQPLSAADKAQFYEESRSFAYLFGVPPERMPADWSAFEAEVDRMSNGDELHVGPLARDTAQFLLRPDAPLQRVISAWFRPLTGALLPPRLRRDFDLFGTRRVRWLVPPTIAAMRPVYSALPSPVRYVAAAVEADGRVSGKRHRGRELLSKVAERARLGVALPPRPDR